ncbi:amino acid adenylation domain-containing protein [Phormidium sp. LEGE 05292]|uniref:non-ribosomal peptide synthetase n=1 Tax=[Phormidium] sp. LEGE 05292 TaxID=767427 RepID=UPI00187FC373|nr:non-ribosomal peptide synthetase [Phormidium sp. LEGE 05292]MBE9224522.1 amino acid adenylation domain-containing protein [Phormidium sp. LEGE 05292]
MSSSENLTQLKSRLSPAKQALLENRLRGGIKLDSQTNSPQEELPKIVLNPDEENQKFPLTDVQQAYWIGRQNLFDLGNVASQAYLEIDTINLDLELFEKAWQQLIKRHGMLRAIVLPDGQQQILAEVPDYKIKVLDLRKETPEIVSSQLADIRSHLSHQKLPSDRWPLFSIQASLLNNQKTRLHFNFDVLICDVSGLGIISRELTQLMQNPETVLPPLELSFRDYVLAEIAFHNSETYHRSLKYWQNRLANLPPSPELPLLKNLTSIKHPQFVRRTKKLAPDSWQRLKQKATQINITPSGLLLAAFAEILTTWSKNPQFSLNLTLFNPLPLHPQVNQIVGDFTSVTLLAVDNSKQESFEVRTQRIQKQLWESLDRRYVSGVQVLRELARNRGQASAAFMPVVFTSSLIQSSQNQQSVPMSWLGELVYSITQTPQVYLDHQVFEDAGTLILHWDAVEEVFPEKLLDDMFAAYSNFLEDLANKEELWQTKTRQFLPAEQLQQLAKINETDTLVHQTNLLHKLFFDRVAQHPQQAAIITENRTLTYQELSDRVNQIAHQLRQKGIRPNQLVAIVMEKGWEQIVAALGILASGAAYVPIDPGLPSERRSHLLQETEAQFILTQSWLETALEFPENIIRFCIDTSETSSFPTPLEPIQKPSDLAYVIYTSGSTGLPKGVTIDHQGAVNTILDINQRFNVKYQDRVFALSSLSFDLSVYDIFGTLAAGGTIVIPDANATKDPDRWLQLIAKYQVTIWNSVPTLMQMLVEYAASRSQLLPQSLRLILLSGDWLPLNLPNQIRAVFEQAQVISLGGATEASIWSILYPIEQVDPTWKSIPYGRPMRHQRFYVLNEALEQCPIWVTGQLYIGGIGLAQGYWRNPEKTNASFIIHPQTQERLYKTGDLGRYLPDGNIEFIGREDFQVKVNGHRIELGEIEVTLKQHSSVKEAIVTAIGESQENKQLVAYIVPNSEEISNLFEGENADFFQESKTAEWRNFLQKKLPEYMVPADFFILNTLPLTSNGKIDRRALPAPKSTRPKNSLVYVKPQTEVEQMIAAIWQEILQIEKVGIHDNFFELGGNSLLLIRTQVKLQEIFTQELPIMEMINSPNIDSLAKYFTQKQTKQTATDRGLNRAEYRKQKIENRKQKVIPNPS